MKTKEIKMKLNMIDRLKEDIQSGVIKSLRLVKVHNEAIRNNCYALIFDIVRPISFVDDKKFYLKTQKVRYGYTNYDGINYRLPDRYEPTNEFADCVAYYDAFDYYDGKILRKTESFSAVVDQKDAVQITEYEVLR